MVLCNRPMVKCTQYQQQQQQQLSIVYVSTPARLSHFACIPSTLCASLWFVIRFICWCFYFHLFRILYVGLGCCRMANACFEMEMARYPLPFIRRMCLCRYELFDVLYMCFEWIQNAMTLSMQNTKWIWHFYVWSFHFMSAKCIEWLLFRLFHLYNKMSAYTFIYY